MVDSRNQTVAKPLVMNKVDIGVQGSEKSYIVGKRIVTPISISAHASQDFDPISLKHFSILPSLRVD